MKAWLRALPGSGMSCLILAAALAQGNPAPAEPEIRITRNEGYAATSSEVRIRPESVLVIKHFDPMQRPGDTIGVFGIRSQEARFEALWRGLEKWAGASEAAEGAESSEGAERKGPAPDSRMLAVSGTRGKKTREFLVPLQPPVPSWAKEFLESIDSLETAAQARPVWGLTLGMKPLAHARRQKTAALLRNPGTHSAVLPAGAVVKVQMLAKPGSEGWPAGGPVWGTLAEVRLESDLRLGPGEAKALSVTIALPKKGMWYARARFEARGSMVPDSSWVFGEVFSPVDSVAIR